MKNILINKKHIFYLLGFIVLSVFLLSREKPINVVYTDPENKSEEVSESKQINIKFNREINNKTKEKIVFKINPEIRADSSWIADTYKIIPKNILNNNTKYSITVSYSDKDIYNFSFSTQTFSQEDIDKYGKLQTENDLLFGEAQTSFYKKYPFYSYLPLKTKDYIVDFNPEKNQFIITFIDINQEKQKKDEITKEAISNIKTLGVKEPIKYYTQ